LLLAFLRYRAASFACSYFYRAALRAGLGSALLNTAMKQTYLLPTARNVTTGQKVKTQDLTGARFTLNQHAMAQEVAEQVARSVSERTGEVWEPVVVEYTPSARRSKT